MFVAGRSGARGPRKQQITDNAVTRDYRRALARVGRAPDPWDQDRFNAIAGLGDAGSTAAGIAKEAFVGLASKARGDIAELRMAVTLSAAASVAAAIGSALLLLRSGGRGRR